LHPQVVAVVAICKSNGKTLKKVLSTGQDWVEKYHCFVGSSRGKMQRRHPFSGEKEPQ
jgi:hypothetical protein